MEAAAAAPADAPQGPHGDAPHAADAAAPVAVPHGRDSTPEADARSAPGPALASSSEVYVVDKNVANWQQLAASVPQGAGLILLDTGSSGVEQLRQALEGRSGLTALHILSHGSAGEITLGNETLDVAGLARSAGAWQAIGASLGADGDILLYGCDVGADGQRFVQALGRATGADVAASSDATGAASRQGDWSLEVGTGLIESRAFAATDYDGLLAAPTVSTTTPRITVSEPSSLNAPGADRATLSGWTLTDDGAGNVTVDVTVENPALGALSSASMSGVTTVPGGYRFVGSVADANAWINQLVFTAADTELGNATATTRILVSITDSETPALTANRALDVTITPSNDPTTVADAAQTVSEGGTTVLTGTTLNAIDPEVTVGSQNTGQIVYGIATNTTHGYLTLNGERIGVGSVFTQADVLAGRVAYVHTATGADQNLDDSFVIVVNDGATPLAGSDHATITLNVTPLNQPPVLSGGGSVFEGQPPNAIDPSGNPASVVGNFIVADGGGDDASGDLTVRLTSLPTDGTLYFTGTVLIGGVPQNVTNRAITQADIDAGFVFGYDDRGGLTYGNNGQRDNNGQSYPFTDGFGVTVSDAGGGTGTPSSTSGTIAINVRPANDDPVLDPGSTLEASVDPAGGGYTVTLTPGMLGATDVDSSDDNLTFAVTSMNGLNQGYLLLDGKILPPGGTFTMEDVRSGRVQYVQTQGAAAGDTDTFSFQVVDNTLGPTWDANGNTVIREGADRNPDGTLKTYEFTINLVETPAGNGDLLQTIDGTVTTSGSNHAGTDQNGATRGTLSEGGSVVLGGTGSDFNTVPGLSYVVEGVPPSQVIYTVTDYTGTTGPVRNGVLQRFDGAAWVDIDTYETFTQEDLNAGRIRFQHDGDVEDFESAVSLSVTAGVAVGGVRNVWNTSFSFFITPINDVPVATGSSNTVIREGETAYLTTGQIRVVDADDAASESYLEGSPTLLNGDPNYAFNNAGSGPGAMQFEFDSLPTGGQLQYWNGAAWVAVTVGQRIDASLITGSAGTTGLRFVSDGSEVRTTQFNVHAVDRWGAASNPVTVGIQITNVNDAPVIAPDPTQPDPPGTANQPLTVAEGGRGQITPGMLRAFDPDSTLTQLQYTITSVTTHGRIMYSTDGVNFVALGVGSSFTQADVNAGRIYYFNSGDESDGHTEANGDPPSDRFTFTLSDGDKEQTGGQFWIYVTPLNDAPTVTAPAGPIDIDSSNPAHNPVPGFNVGDTDLDAVIQGETDFVQVTVRLLDANGNPLNAAAYAGATIGSTSMGGVTVDADKNGNGDFLTLRGTRAQVNAALAGLTLTFDTDRDQAYRLQVIVDDRLRDTATGVLQPGANGGPQNEPNVPGGPNITIPTTEYDWYTDTVPTTGDITGNLAAASVLVRASSENDPGVLVVPPVHTVYEDQPTYIGTGFVVSDPESAAFGTPITLRLIVPNGTLGIGGTGGQTSFTLPSGRVVTIAGDNTGALTLTGRASDIQELITSGAATGLTYRSATHVNHDLNGADAGDVTLTVSFDDTGSQIGGDTGGGSVSNNPPDMTMALTIVAVNDAPTAGLTPGTNPNTPLYLTGGNAPSAVPGFVVRDLDIDGDGGGIAPGEADFLQVTVRITNGTGVPLGAAQYTDGGSDAIIVTSSNAAGSGVTIDSTYDGTGSALVIRGTRAQVQAYLDGLQVALGGSLANTDQTYRVQVIVDDRLRENSSGALAGGANGGENNNANGGTVAVPTTNVNPYALIPAGLTANVASAYRTLFPSSINDPAHIAAGNPTVDEGNGSVTLTGLTVTDQDAAATDVLTATVSVPPGFVINGVGGSGGTVGPLGGASITITGTLAQINSRINAISIALLDAPGAALPADWNGAFTVTVVVNDEGHTGGRPGVLAPGDNSTTGTFAYADGVSNHLVTTRTFVFTVAPVNDAPVVVGGTTQTLPNVTEDVGNNAAGTPVGTLFGSHFDDGADLIDNSGNGGTGGSSSDTFFGVAITGHVPDPAQGAWQYSLDNGTTWIPVGARTDGTALVLAADAQLRFVPAANFHGTPTTLTVRLVETDTNNDSATADPTSGSTVNVAGANNGGTTVYSAGTIVLSTTVINVNDRPTATDATVPAGVEDVTGAGVRVDTLLGGGYGDAIDNQTAISGGGDASTSFGGIAIVGNNANAAQGAWEYSLNGTDWLAVPTGASDTSALLLPTSAQLRFVPAADFNGTPGGLVVRVSDAPVAAGSGDISATVNDDTSQWSVLRNVSTTIAPRNDAPVIGGTTGATAVENNQTGTGVSIPPVALVSGGTVGDLDLATTPGLAAGVFGAGSLTVSLDGYQPGDQLFVNGALPPGVSVSGGNGAPLVVQFDADTTVAEVRAVLDQLSYRSSSDNPTAFGTDNERVYTIVLNDGNNVQPGGNAGGPQPLNSNVLTGTLTITAVNDPPIAVDDTHSIDEDTVSVGSNVITGRIPGEADSDPDNTTAQLSVTSIRTGPEFGAGSSGTLGNPLTGTYGSIVLNADGSYTYTLDNSDPRVQALIAGETLTDLLTYAISDGAGGTDIAQITITIRGASNDVPGITVTDANGNATGQVTVHESGLTSVGDTSETAGAGFNIAAADGVASINVGGTVVTLAQLQALTPGAPITINTPDGQIRLTGFSGTTLSNGVVIDGTVSYTYTLTSAQNHSAGEVTEAVPLSVTDRDGDVASGTLTVLIVNDVPTANPDTNSITEDAAPNPVSGNVKTNDREGADTAVPVTGVSFGGNAGTVGSALGMEYGSIVLNANGTYSYTLNNSDPRVNALKDGETLTDTVSYTLTDADGDTSTTTLTITIHGRTDASPEIVPVDGNGAATGQTEVHERGLVDGPGGPDARENGSGVVTVSAADGLQTVTVGGRTLTLAELANLGTTPVVITTPLGTLTLTGFTATASVGGVPTAGNLAYTYTLRAQVAQPNATESTEAIDLQVTDAGGATATGTLTVRIVDDVPQATDDAAAITEDAAPNTVSGNVASNDTIGADDRNVAPVTGVSFGGAAGTVGASITTTYGAIVLNADGSYTYTLNNADPRVQALSVGEMLTEQVRYTITDADGDTSTATLTITIRGANDLPGIAVTDANGAATGQVTVFESGLVSITDTGERAASSFNITAADGVASINVGGTVVTLAQLQALTPGAPITITTPDGQIQLTGFSGTTLLNGIVTGGAVSYTYVLGAAQSHRSGGVLTEVTEQIALSVTDRDGDVANGTLTVLIVNDTPQATDDTAAITEDAVPDTVSGNVKANDRDGADNGNGVPVTGVSFGGAAGTVGVSLTTTYGAIVLNADGSYTYTLDNDNAAVNALKTNEQLTETVRYTITDADGDTSTATLTITIHGRLDGDPAIGAVDGNGAATGQAEVHERGLVDGPAGPDTREHATGTIVVSASDGMRSVTVGGRTLALAELANLGTTPVTIDTPRGTLVLTGFTPTSSVGGVPTTGELAYTYTLDGQVAQPNATESTEDIALLVTDAGGDTATGTLTVRIVDDVPEAVNDTNAITEDGAPNTVGGDVKANDTIGADDANGVPVTGVSFGGVAGTVGVPITTTYGRIVLNADGSYTYTLNNADPRVQALVVGDTLTEVVSYTITDADGDTSTATLTLTIHGANDGVTLVIGDNNGPDTTGQATVYERGLVEPGDASETVSGSFFVTAPDGLGSIAVHGTTLTPAQLAALGTSPVTIATDRGRITLTGFDAATGTVRYTYVLGAAQSHAGGQVTDDIALQVTDRDGDTTQGTLRVLVIDDVPTARNDATSIGTARPGATATGNVFGGSGMGANDVADRLGADGTPTPVTGVSFEGVAGTIGGSTAGRYGNLRLNADGSYSYSVNASNVRVASLGDGQTLTEVFDYVITDADGSTSTAKLVVTIHGTSQHRPLTGDQVFPADFGDPSRRIDQSMTPALFVQIAVQESQRLSQMLSGAIAARALGGDRLFGEDRPTDLWGEPQGVDYAEHVSRDGVAFSLRMVRDVEQTLALRGVTAGKLVDGASPLFGDFESVSAPHQQPPPEVPEAPARDGGRIVVPRADAAHPSTEAAQAEAAPAAGAAAPVAADTARSFSSRVAAAAAERDAVRDLLRHPQRATPTVRVPTS
ncbi:MULTISPECIES: VCBS domain-containing protein [unclassified Variovorax]|uniref:VCBS domain-containing protein n=1 Tax=unclassified Variovorax TaxID=663243 RepID=UPI0032E5358E